MRTQIVAGNWKMNMLEDEAISLVSEIMELTKSRPVPAGGNARLVIIPPFPWIPLAVSHSREEPVVSVGAQNCYHRQQGAYTGEVSADMIRSAGAEYVVLGHSERRQYFGESHDFLKLKTEAVLDQGLQPVFCCGESLEARESGQQNQTVKKQLDESIFHLPGSRFRQLIIAYEPVWAIGTGKTARPEQAREMHTFIRELIAENYGPALADETSILYGGSCKPGNAKELFAQPNVD
ncbi:MAG: triose-phosphate isomerase, partial [Bacteroidales bacterium]